ncbi:MAG: EAL domain-containing protein [Clostridia bacterium]|nr:EAL domain-containing protein [Clostridia bacterium]NCC43676.1 EAL domain-containing protein [Clostridia bacterium]
MKEIQTILIVEDEAINRRILKKILSDKFLIIEAENGAAAWDILHEKTQDIGAVLLDLIMPVMDGYRLLEKIRQASMTELPVIVMTGESDVETEKKALDAGAWDFVTKPYNAKILLSRLNNAMARRQASVYKKMQKMSAHDPLTGLHNRNRMFEQTRRMIDEHPDVKFVFIRADIDHFALYNSAFGEEEGNRLLCYLARQFESIARAYDICSFGRINADIFCACIPYSGDDKKLRAAVDQTQKKLAEYRKNYLLEISVGVYIIEEPSLSVEEFFIRASMGVQKCKRQYGNHIGYYDESVGKRAAEEIAITNVMERALREKEFVVYLQPKVDLSTDHACGAEALVRWKSPSKGLISPGVFIPVFERNGFIAKLDYYVWEATCQMLHDWIGAGWEPSPVSVNISRISMYDPRLVKRLVELVERYQIPCALLQLEVTESAYMSSPGLMKETIHALRTAGFTILMDDFGSGYSSLNTLKEIEVDILKIDMKFLPIGDEVEKGEIILASIIKMANWLGMSVVVEGVETREQRDFLEGTGCDCVQGYYYARPMPQEEYEQGYVFREKSQEDPVIVDKQPLHNVTILIIDDEEVDRAILKGMLEERFHIHTCQSAEEGLAYLKRNQSRVRLILVDNVMPGMSGLEFMAYCQDSSSLRFIPRIMITSDDDVNIQVKAFQNGAYDYIKKPLIKEVVLARVNHVMGIIRQYRVFESVEYEHHSLGERDPVTRLLNKNAFYAIGERYLGNYPEDKVALIVADVDNFKEINDVYGHLIGDAAIQCVAETLKREFRKTDLIGRFGGDEFMILMSNLPDEERAKKKASEIIKSVAVSCAKEVHVSVGLSVGVAFRETYVETEDTIISIFNRADLALYEAKKTGKGKAVIYGEKVPPIADDDKPLILICSEDPQLHPTIALAYGDSAAFANITSMQSLIGMFEQYEKRIFAVCLDVQKRSMHDSDDFYQYILEHGGGTSIALLAVCKEGDMEALRAALELEIQDVLTLPPQLDVIQKKLSRILLMRKTNSSERKNKDHTV